MPQEDHQFFHSAACTSQAEVLIVEDFKNSANEKVIDSQATIGFKLAQARNCLGAFVRSHKIPHLIYTHLSNVVHLAKPSAHMQALDLTKGAAVDARPDGRACYPVTQFRCSLRKTKTGRRIGARACLSSMRPGDVI